MNFKAFTAAVLSLALFGCSADNAAKNDEEEKVFRYATTAYGLEMGNSGLNPCDNYSGWSATRYGVGETLFRFDENMRLEPWLAEGYEQIDDYTLKIRLRDNVYFSSGRKMDGNAVKECFEKLISEHDRAPYDLNISKMEADGQSITITSNEKTTDLPNYLSDPYAVIIDTDYGVTEDNNVAGTGPFIAYEVADDHIYLKKNENYWGGEVKTDRVEVTSITDGDTLTMALQSGQADAAQGLPYASLPIFEKNDEYKISSVDTSRTFFMQLNFNSPILNDERVRQAIACSVDKDGFANVLLNGNGSAAEGPFPINFTFGDKNVSGQPYDADKAKALLAEAGWTDTDGDGYADKDGKPLTLRWLTYPARQELPVLAEAAQATFKQAGIMLDIQSTPNHLKILPTNEWDIYASAFVTAPTGDPAYFFTTHCLENSAKNRGGYYNAELEKLYARLKDSFDENERKELAIKMQEIILNDNSFIFVSHLKMSFVMKQNVKGFNAHPSDYYEITADLEV